MPLSFLSLSVLAFASLSAVGAWAETTRPAVPTPLPAPSRLDPVVVKGAKTGGQYSGQNRSALGFDLSDRETPQSVLVVIAAQMENFGLRSVNDVLAGVAGVTVEQFETDRTYFTGRGFDISNFQFDGIGMPFTYTSQFGDLDTAVFEQVDVLRGANGLLSATGNPSATVNFVRKRPTTERRASGALTLGSWRNRRVEADVSGPFDEGKHVRGRVIAVGERGNSYLDRYGVTKSVLTGLLDVDFGSATRLDVGYLAQYNDARSPMWGALPLVHSDGTPTDYPVSTSTASDWSRWNNIDRRAHAELTHDFGQDWTAKAVALHRNLYYSSNLLYVYNEPDPVSGLGLEGFPSRALSQFTQKMVDLRLNGPLVLGGRRHELMAGLSWGFEKVRARADAGETVQLETPDLSTWNGQVSVGPYEARATSAHFDMRRRSAYGAIRLRPNDRLGVILGANATHAVSNGMSYGVAHQYEASAVTPYVGAVYEVSAPISVYGSYTRIFNPQSEIDAHGSALPAIQGSNLEAGVKTEWLDKRLAASLAVYRTRQQNTAEQAGELPDFTTYYRPVDTTSTGVEAEVSGRPLPGWDLAAGVSQLRLRDEHGKDTRTFVPRRTLHLSTSYRLPTVPALQLGARLNWQSAVHNDQDNFTVRQDGYALVDLMAKYQINPRAHLIFNVKNVTNQKRLASLYWRYAYYGPPRNLSATLHWMF